MTSDDRPVLVVGYDGHERAAATLRFAADFATRLDARLHVVHVVDLDDYPVDPDSAFWDEKGVEAINDERDAAAAMLQDWDGSWTYAVEHGDPVKALIKAAARTSALLIIVGARAGGSVRHFFALHGSVSSGLSAGSIPVLVAPPDSATDQHLSASAEGRGAEGEAVARS